MTTKRTISIHLLKLFNLHIFSCYTPDYYSDNLNYLRLLTFLDGTMEAN